MQQRAIVGVAVAVSLILLGVLVSVFLVVPVDDTPAPSWAPPVAAPPRLAEPTTPGVSGIVEPEWLAATAARTGIPERALAAYAGAAVFKAESSSDCGLSWATLAAIGYVESKHGSHHGSVLGDDGTVRPGIFGVALAGGETDHVPDSDGGSIDGDAEFDRAVGPMQLIPQTWRNWHIEASGDGIEDPQNIDDAVMATANYLCRASESMSDEAGWRQGISAYNSADSYLGIVASAAVAYAG